MIRLCILLSFFALAEWTNVVVDSDLPSKRAGHTISNYNGELYLFGGCDLDTACYSDVYRFNMTVNMWELLNPTGDIPTAREGHIAAVVGSKLYISGGTTLTDLLDETNILDLTTLEWKEAELGGSIEPRAYHAAALHDSGLIFIFGGYTSEGLSNEVILLDTVNNHWGYPASVGSVPSARKYHSLSRIGDFVWLFGGETDSGAVKDLYYYDIDERHWYKQDTSGSPLARQGHATAVSGDSFYVSAGCNSDTRYCYSDLYKFYTENNTWDKVDSGSTFSPREGHAIEFIGGNLYAFGGRFLTESSYGDFLVFETNETCPNGCSRNGECTDYGCDCYGGYTGSDCSYETTCRMNCNSHGVCDDYTCVCYSGYYGSYCQGIINCPNNCTSSEQGTCQSSGECLCTDGYTGDDCSEKEDWKMCQDSCINGSCDSNNDCVCSSGWVGKNCDTEAPVVYHKSSSYDISINLSDDLEYGASKESYDGSSSSYSSSGSYSDDDTSDYRSSDTGESDDYYMVESEDVEVSEESFDNITDSQDASANMTQYDNSTHLLVPQMFGFTDPNDPNSYYTQNLRRDPVEVEKSDYLEELEDKQEDRQDEIEECQMMCNYHGVCSDATCYCEEGYTGTLCEYEEDEADNGIKLTTAIIIMMLFWIIGCAYGCYRIKKIMEEVRAREESKVEEKDDFVGLED
ncbi:unnamed protein product [Blepharisma stoltei]|uniref:EGF-like domain-containing protein n=1 Tax=Blepharisma stoltei TaxID=1481888 RepID=A0AAU9IYC5_9CILI|nr:unnamed protein product [Blepharisma stoltei]